MVVGRGDGHIVWDFSGPIAVVACASSGVDVVGARAYADLYVECSDGMGGQVIDSSFWGYYALSKNEASGLWFNCRVCFWGRLRLFGGFDLVY